MKRVLAAMCVAGAVLWWAGQAGVANAFSEPDAVYYGTASVNGQPAAPGTQVSARVAGDRVAATAVGLDPAGGNLYVLRVPVVRTTAPTDPRPLGHARIGDYETWLQFIADGLGQERWPAPAHVARPAARDGCRH